LHLCREGLALKVLHADQLYFDWLDYELRVFSNNETIESLIECTISRVDCAFKAELWNWFSSLSLSHTVHLIYINIWVFSKRHWTKKNPARLLEANLGGIKGTIIKMIIINIRNYLQSVKFLRRYLLYSSDFLYWW
jgi:hypothetical protein